MRDANRVRCARVFAQSCDWQAAGARHTREVGARRADCGLAVSPDGTPRSLYARGQQRRRPDVDRELPVNPRVSRAEVGSLHARRVSRLRSHPYLPPFGPPLHARLYAPAAGTSRLVVRHFPIAPETAVGPARFPVLVVPTLPRRIRQPQHRRQPAGDAALGKKEGVALAEHIGQIKNTRPNRQTGGRDVTLLQDDERLFSRRCRR